MPRGGKRPGAGAPRGNLNALKSGRHSVHLRALATALSSIPSLRDILLSYARHQARQEKKARRIAHALLTAYLQSVTNNPTPPSPDRPQADCPPQQTPSQQSDALSGAGNQSMSPI